jgi:hypothetical protein
MPIEWWGSNILWALGVDDELHIAWSSACCCDSIVWGEPCETGRCTTGVPHQWSLVLTGLTTNACCLSPSKLITDEISAILTQGASPNAEGACAWYGTASITIRNWMDADCSGEYIDEAKTIEIHLWKTSATEWFLFINGWEGVYQGHRYVIFYGKVSVTSGDCTSEIIINQQLPRCVLIGWPDTGEGSIEQFFTGQWVTWFFTTSGVATLVPVTS